MKSVLFVCTGNICRSPTADAILRRQIKRDSLPFISDSCGTHAYHVGEVSDRRSVSVARSRGYDMSDLRARKIKTSDFDDFDYIIALDREHEQILRGLCPNKLAGKIKLLLDYTANSKGMDVPDPYYGDKEGFEKCCDLVEQGVNAFIKIEGAH